MTMPLFEQLVEQGHARALAVCTQRGAQYGDSWRACPWLVLRAVLRCLGYAEGLSPNQLRIIALAALCDVKYARLAGGWKADTAVDLGNYLAALEAAMRQENEDGVE